MGAKKTRHVVDVLERRIALGGLRREPRHDVDTRDRGLRDGLRRMRIELPEPAGAAVCPELPFAYQIRSQDSDVGDDEALGANRHILPLPGQRGSEHDVLWTVHERL